jgi:hypothetical protein
MRGGECGMGPGVPVPLCGSGCVSRACRERNEVWRRSYKAYKALQGSFFSPAGPVPTRVPVPGCGRVCVCSGIAPAVPVPIGASAVALRAPACAMRLPASLKRSYAGTSRRDKMARQVRLRSKAASGFAGQLRRDRTAGQAGWRRAVVSGVVGKVGDGWGSFARGTRGGGARPRPRTRPLPGMKRAWQFASTCGAPGALSAVKNLCVCFPAQRNDACGVPRAV